MNRLWVKRIGVTAALWAVLCVVAAIIGSRPRPLLLGAGLLAVAAVTWLVSDLAAQAEMVSWDAGYQPYQRVRGDDVRVRRLLHLLQDTSHPETFTRDVHPLLVELVDDRLDTRYGVDRHEHPQAARQLLGEDLLAFVTTPPPARASADPRYLSTILTRIESL
ncbi:MAG: hypothetical protein ACXVYY_09600 [Oryzihumus sp.]